jgi:hypothetical protein
MNTQTTNNKLRLLGIATVFALSGAGVKAQSHTVSLSPGTVVAAHLQDDLSSNNSTKGDRFTATVDDNSSNSNWNSNSLPAGSKINGYVRSVVPQKDKNPGILDLAFNRVILPDGRSYSIQGSLISLDNKSVTKDKHGRLVATKGHTTNRLTYVGYGAGAGALIGLITSRKHLFEDTLLGAGAGYLFGALQKGQKPSNVDLKPGTQLGVRLDNRLSYSRN